MEVDLNWPFLFLCTKYRLSLFRNRSGLKNYFISLSTSRSSRDVIKPRRAFSVVFLYYRNRVFGSLVRPTSLDIQNNFSIKSNSLLISLSILSFSLFSYSSLKTGFFGSLLSSSILSMGLRESLTPPVTYLVQFLVGEFSIYFLVSSSFNAINLIQYSRRSW